MSSRKTGTDTPSRDHLTCPGAGDQAEHPWEEPRVGGEMEGQEAGGRERRGAVRGAWRSGEMSKEEH